MGAPACVIYDRASDRYDVLYARIMWRVLPSGSASHIKKAYKGTRWMPRHAEAMKDV